MFLIGLFDEWRNRGKLPGRCALPIYEVCQYRIMLSSMCQILGTALCTLHKVILNSYNRGKSACLGISRTVKTKWMGYISYGTYGEIGTFYVNPERNWEGFGHRSINFIAAFSKSSRLSDLLLEVQIQSHSFFGNLLHSSSNQSWSLRSFICVK